MHIDVCALPSFDVEYHPIIDHYKINSNMGGLPIPVQSMDEIMADKMVAFAFRARRIKQNSDLVIKKLAARKKSMDEFLKNIHKHADLIKDDEVKALISTIGGMNSNSMIPYLDFDLIREKRKIICGYSDVTSLHLSILKYSGLRTLYGPAIMTWFGEYPNGIEDSIESFLTASMNNSNETRTIEPFSKWSNHFRDWSNGDWKTVPREWKDNNGWKVLNSGKVEGEIVVVNLNTLISSAGTDYFPDVDGKILLIEEMAAPWSKEERSLTQLKLMGVFDKT